MIKRYLAGHPTLRLVALAASGAIVGIALILLTAGARPALYVASADVRLVSTASAEGTYDAVRSALLQAPGLAQLAVSPIELLRVGARLDPPATAGELANRVRARAETDHLIIRIDARSEAADRAAAIANLTAENLVSRFAAQVHPGGVTLAPMQPAIPPEHPSYPYLVRDVAIAGLAGATLVAALGLGLGGGVGRSSAPARSQYAGPPVEWSAVVLEPRASRRRRLLIGVGLGVLILAAMALGLRPFAIQALTVLAAAVAALSPGAGLATIATIIVMPGPPGFEPLGVAPILIAATAYGVLLEALRMRRRAALAPLGILAAGYLAISAIDAFPAISGFGPERTVDATVRLIQGGAGIVLLASAWLYFSRHDPRPYLAVAAVAAGAAGALGILQISTSSIPSLPLAGLIYDPAIADTVARATGPFGNPNYFGYFCGLGLIMVTGLLPALPGIIRPVLLVALLALAGGLALSFSRGALLATLGGLFVLVWMRSRVAGAAFAVALALSIFVLYPAVIELREFGGGATLAAAEEGVSLSDSLRLGAVQSAIPIFLTDPLVGVGFGQYGYEAVWFVGSSPVTSSHNEFLSILAEQGIAGSAIFGAAALLLVRRLRRSTGRVHDLVTAVLVAFAVGWLTLEPLASLQTSGTVWLVLAAVASTGLEESPVATGALFEKTASPRRGQSGRTADAGA